MDGDARLLIGDRGIWSATPWNYSSLRCLEFREDGSGKLIYGYGQTIYAVIQCRWEIPSPGSLSLTYLDSRAYQFFKVFTPGPQQNVRELGYRLLEGGVAGIEDVVARPFRFRLTLELSEPPWPSSLKLPYEVPRIYYGHCQSDKQETNQSG